MRYPHILAAIRSAKWAVQPATLHAIRDTLSARLKGQHSGSQLSALDYELDDGEAVVPPPPFTIIAPGVALVEARGIIGKHLSGFEMMCGGCDLEALEANLLQAITFPGVASIILHIDSPGGVVTGVPELAAKIRLWRQTKPIYAFTDTLAASAGYWLASACTGIFCTPTADLGSIGVYIALVDESAAWTAEGYKLVLIKAGTEKAAGIAGSEITPEQVARWQAEVDVIYGMFTADVTTARPGVASETMQGQCFMGAAAVAANLADEVLPDRQTLADTLAIAMPAM